MIIQLLTQITALLVKILDALNYIIKLIKQGGEHGREIISFLKRHR